MSSLGYRLVPLKNVSQFSPVVWPANIYIYLSAEFYYLHCTFSGKEMLKYSSEYLN